MNIDNLPKALVTKIQALLRLQESANAIGSIEEAANAASKIRNLLLKHNLELQDILAQGGTNAVEEPIVQPLYNPNDFTRPHEGKWITTLTDTIARFNMGRVIITKNRATGEDNIYIIATKSNAELIWYTVEMLSDRIRPMAKAAFSKYVGPEKRNTYIRGYYLGACAGIREQLTKNREDEINEARMLESMKVESRNESQTTQLAIANMLQVNERKLTNYIQENFRLRSGSGPKSKGMNGRQQGKVDGSNMNLGVGQRNQRRIG